MRGEREAAVSDAAATVSLLGFSGRTIERYYGCIKSIFALLYILSSELLLALDQYSLYVNTEGSSTCIPHINQLIGYLCRDAIKCCNCDVRLQWKRIIM